MALPTFAAQPAAQTVQAGQSATFAVTATVPAGTTPPEIMFQWQRHAPGGAWADIGGATAAVYTTPVLAVADNGTAYRCRATNAGDTAVSAEVAVTVTARALWPDGVNNVVSGVRPPRLFGTTAKEAVLLTIVIILLLVLAWIIKGTMSAPPAPPKVVTCASMCLETRVAVGEAVAEAKKACERVCAPVPSTATAAVQPPSAGQALQAATASAPAAPPAPPLPQQDDIATCIVDLMSHKASRADAESHCRLNY